MQDKPRSISILKGFGNYYVLDGIAYDIDYPLTWAISPSFIEIKRLNTDTKHFETKSYCSGPKTCTTCLKQGTIHGVFVHNCDQCSSQNYEYERHRLQKSKQNKNTIGYDINSTTCIL
jgi:hypothetical protein